MLDFGWSELFLIVALAVIFMGPEDIPRVMVALGRIARRFTYIKYVISKQFDDVMRDADLDEIRKSVNFEADDKYSSQNFDDAQSDEAYAALVTKEGSVAFNKIDDDDGDHTHETDDGKAV